MFYFSSRRRHTRWPRDWSSDVCSSDLRHAITAGANAVCARLSTTGEDHADLAGSPFPVLPGEMTRLVRFGPGQPPPPAAPEGELPADLIAELADEDPDTRVPAMASVLH